MSRAVIQCGWDDVPHLTDAMIQTMSEGMMPHLKEARMKGIPNIGSGAIYPVDEQDIIFDPREIEIDPAWRKAYGLDVGWKRNAAVWGAHDTDSDIIYLHDEYYRGHAEPVVHASAIKARGKWIPGIIDSAAHGSNQENGRKLFDLYTKEGLTLHNANKAVDAGLLNVFQRLSTGRLRVSKNMANWLSEFRIYRRNDKGRIVKENDHLMDATRYLVMGVDLFQQIPVDLYKSKLGNGSRADMGYDMFDSNHVSDNNYKPF